MFIQLQRISLFRKPVLSNFPRHHVIYVFVNKQKQVKLLSANSNCDSSTRLCTGNYLIRDFYYYIIHNQTNCEHHAISMDNILHGPKLKFPIPTDSLGIRLFKLLQTINPEEILYIDAETHKKTTYKKFLTLACRLANALQNFGCTINDVIVTSSENCTIYYIPTIAAFYLGLISAFVDHNYVDREMEHMLEIFGPKIVFCSSKVLDKFATQKENLKSIEKIIIIEDDEVSGYDNLKSFIEKYGDDDFSINTFKPVELNTRDQVAVIVSSSGTTGMPKGVMVTHDNIAMRINQLENPDMCMIEKETYCVFLPGFHLYGMIVNITNMYKKTTIILMKRFNEEKLLKTIQTHRVTSMAIVPTVANILIKCDLLGRIDVSSILEIFCAGAPLQIRTEEKLIEKFPNLRCFRQGYGMSESTFAVTLTRTGFRKPGSSGTIVPETSIFVRDIRTGKSLGPKQRGEICIKGRMVTKGYYRNPEMTNKAFVNGWLHTGDLGYYDDDGYFFIVDRIKDLLKYKGFQVAPTEIESILITHPKIREAVVVGKPDELAGDLPTAFIVKEPGSDLTKKEVIDFVAKRISKTKHLHGGVYFVDEFPKTSTGKMSRRILRETYFKENRRK